MICGDSSVSTVNNTVIHKNTNSLHKSSHVHYQKNFSFKEDRKYNLDNYKYYYIIECFSKKCIFNSSFMISRSFLSFILNNTNSLLVSTDITNIQSTYYIATNFDLFKFLRRQGGFDEEQNTDKIHYSLFNNK